MLDIAAVRRLASRWGWVEVQFNEQSAVLGFKRGGERCNVYYTTGTVGTALDHPTSGRTQLFRRNRTLSHLGDIFRDPRVHSGVGYYRRHSCSRPEPSQQAPAAGLWCALADDSLTDDLVNNWSDDCATLALGEGYFVIERDGSTWWHGIPLGLDNKLRGRQKRLPRPDYVALGPDDRAFVQFTDGDWVLWGPDSLADALNGRPCCAVEQLAFAPDDGWYVLWEDGRSAWKGLPRALHNVLVGRQKSLPGVESLAVGPRGEWFVRFLDGSWRTQGMTASCSLRASKLKRDGHDITSILFGEGPTWAILYS